MEKGSLSNLEIETSNAVLTEDIIKDLKTPIAQREGFRHNPYVVTIPRYYYRLVGIKADEASYYERLYRLDKELSKYGSLYLRAVEGLDKAMSLSLQNNLNDICIKFFNEADIDTTALITAINDKNLIPVLKNSLLSNQIRNNFRGLLDYFLKVNDTIPKEDIKLIIYYTVYWLSLYIKDLLSNFDYGNVNPKILFYGEITKEECFFLNLLSTIGCDILYFNPKSSGDFNIVDKHNSFSREILYGIRKDIKPFPESLKERVKTTAYSVKEELNQTLYSEGSSFYRPWQFSDYNLKSVTLKTTYEEVNIWSKEKAMIRDGWKIERNTVHVPNIFAKVSGTHNNIEQYWKEMSLVVNQKNTLFYHKKLPIIDVAPLEYGKLELIFPDKPHSNFDVDKLLRASWWKYKELRTGLQRTIAEKIKYLCLNPLIMNVEDTGDRDLQVDIFSVLINLDTSIQQMLQTFDYPEEVPKLVIYNNEKNGNLSYEDCIMLTFMNAMGVDIIIYNPSGYNDIENCIYQELYDIHRLEKLSFNLEYKNYVEKKGFFKSLFK
jgi:hypothetical protein